MFPPFSMSRRPVPLLFSSPVLLIVPHEPWIDVYPPILNLQLAVSKVYDQTPSQPPLVPYQSGSANESACSYSPRRRSRWCSTRPAPPSPRPPPPPPSQNRPSLPLPQEEGRRAAAPAQASQTPLLLLLLLLHSFSRTQSSSSLPECKWRTDALFRSSMGVAAGSLRQAIWPAYTYNCADLCLQRPSIKITLMMSERQKARSSGCSRVLFVQSGSSGKLQLVGWLTFLQPYFFCCKT